MSKKTYRAVKRIEARDSKGEKDVIKAGTELDLTAAEAKKLGSAVVEVAEEQAGDDDGTEDQGVGGE